MNKKLLKLRSFWITLRKITLIKKKSLVFSAGKLDFFFLPMHYVYEEIMQSFGDKLNLSQLNNF